MIGSKKKTKKGNVLKEIADNFEHLTSNPERFLKFVFFLPAHVFQSLIDFLL